MGPVHASRSAGPRCQDQCGRRTTTQPDLRTLASAIGNRQMTQLVQERATLARTPYWAEYDWDRATRRRSGSDVHEEVLEALGRASSAYTEAPIPNADKSAFELDDTRGYADLYKATTAEGRAASTIGVTFTGHHAPAHLPSHRFTRRSGERFDHIGTSRPAVVEGHFPGEARIIRLKKAPIDIALGDLKGGFDSTEAAEAPEQIENYMGGITTASTELKSFAADNADRVDTNDEGKREWNPRPRKLRADEIKIPQRYRPPRGRGQPSVRLVLVKSSGFADMDFSKRHVVMGKLYVLKDHREGVWIYAWAPDNVIALEDLPPAVRGLPPEIRERLRRPLMTPPLARRARKLARRVLARQAHDVTDPFKAKWDAWQAAHRDITKRAGDAVDDPGVRDAEAALAMDQANASLRSVGINAPSVADARLQGGRDVREIKLWAGETGLTLGRFRWLFGGAFTKMAELYLRVRDRIRQILKSGFNPGSRFGGGIAGAAVKAAFVVLKGAAHYIVGKTIDRLKASLAQGTMNKLKALISEDFATLESKAKEVADTVKSLESGFIGQIERAVEKLVSEYKAVLDEIADVAKKAGKITSIINKVKWGARVIACLSPPAVGCLWILLQSVIEEAAARVVDTCWFKKKLAPLITGLDWVKRLPAKLAGKIRDLIVPLLPDPLKDVFAKIEVQEAVHVSPEDIGCTTDDDPTTDALTAERRAMLDLIERVGEERFDALIDAMMAAGVRFDKRLTPTEIYKARDIIVSSGVTAKQLRHYAQYYAPFADKREFGPLGAFLTGLAANADPDSAPVFVESGGDGGDATGAAIEGKLTKAPGQTGPHRAYEFVDIENFGSTLAKDAKVNLDITQKISGETVVLRKVPLVVIERSEAPDGEVKIVLSPGRDLAFDVGKRKPQRVGPVVTLSGTSRFWKTFPTKGAAKKPTVSAAAERP